MAQDYSQEPPITPAERQKERDRAAKFKHRTLYALTVECSSEADQQSLFKQLTKRLPERRIRVVVA